MRVRIRTSTKTLMVHNAGYVIRRGRGSMDIDHGRLYVAMAEKFLDHADIVAPPSGCVGDKWPLWFKSRPSATPPGKSAPRCKADEIGGKADIDTRRSAVESRADIPAIWPESPLLAITRQTAHCAGTTLQPPVADGWGTTTLPPKRLAVHRWSRSCLQPLGRRGTRSATDR